MPVSKLNIDEFIAFAESNPVIDVRSPGEYAHAHIPGALSLCIFNDEERKIIGTAYKQESREKAIKLGLDFFGPKMVSIVEAAEKIMADRRSSSREIGVHCWRGGMRSEAMAWLLNLYGFKVYLLTGGYKAYRRWALEQFEKEYHLGVIGGYTGSNKTGLIHALKKKNEQVIDLEGLAGHKGSAFGNLERMEQPSQEFFENLLAWELFHVSAKDPAKIIWIENESQAIGNVNIPLNFFRFFIAKPSYFIDIPFRERLKHIIAGYGTYPKDALINAIVRITKKLGGLEAKIAVNFLIDNDVEGCFNVLLHYYDKLYHKNTVKKKQDEEQITYIACDTTDADLNLRKLLDHAYRN